MIFSQLITDDGVIEINHDKSNNFLKVIPLMLSKDKLTCRKVKAVLRYHEPGAHGSVEQYVHHLLFTFNPYCKRKHLKPPPFSSTLKNYKNWVEIVDRNKSLLEPYGEMVNKVLTNLRSNLTYSDTFSEQGNNGVEEEYDHRCK